MSEKYTNKKIRMKSILSMVSMVMKSKLYE